MKYILIIFGLVVMLALGGCALPVTTVQTVDDRPGLVFIGAPENAVLYLDGVNMGAVAQYNADPKVLTVEPGTHTVRVISGSTVLYDQRIFVESSRKTIKLR